MVLLKQPSVNSFLKCLDKPRTRSWQLWETFRTRLLSEVTVWIMFVSKGVGAARLSSQSWRPWCWVRVMLLHMLRTQGRATVWIVCGRVAAHLESKPEPFKDCLFLQDQSLKPWPHPCEASRLPLVSLSALLSSGQTEWCFKSPLQSFNFHQECCVPSCGGTHLSSLLYRGGGAGGHGELEVGQTSQ